MEPELLSRRQLSSVVMSMKVRLEGEAQVPGREVGGAELGGPRARQVALEREEVEPAEEHRLGGDRPQVPGPNA